MCTQRELPVLCLFFSFFVSGGPLGVRTNNNLQKLLICLFIRKYLTISQFDNLVKSEELNIHYLPFPSVYYDENSEKNYLIGKLRIWCPNVVQ